MTQQADFEEVGLRLGDLTPLRHELLSSRIAGQQVIGGGRVAALGTLSGGIFIFDSTGRIETYFQGISGDDRPVKRLDKILWFGGAGMVRAMPQEQGRHLLALYDFTEGLTGVVPVSAQPLCGLRGEQGVVLRHEQGGIRVLRGELLEEERVARISLNGQDAYWVDAAGAEAGGSIAVLAHHYEATGGGEQPIVRQSILQRLDENLRPTDTILLPRVRGWTPLQVHWNGQLAIVVPGLPQDSGLASGLAVDVSSGEFRSFELGSDADSAFSGALLSGGRFISIVGKCEAVRASELEFPKVIR